MKSIQFPVNICLILVLISGTNGIAYSGCFTLAPGQRSVDLSRIGWTDKWNIDSLGLQFCVNHCAQKQLKYAAIEEAASKQTCYCGDEDAYKKLGVPVSINPLVPCHHSIWSMKAYVATDDFSSQYLGCYKEVADEANMASNTHNWLDTWMMAPNICIKYCEANGEAVANLRNGDLCTCGYSFAKHGKLAETACDKPCVGAQGEKCGGAFANSVYSTLTLDEIVKPGTSVSGHSFNLAAGVNVPNTQVLVKNLLDLQQAVDTKVISDEARDIGDTLYKGQQLRSSIVEMGGPLAALASSQGFGMSNDPSTRNMLSQTFPTELQGYADIIKRAHSFIDQDVKQLQDMVSSVQANVKPLNDATTDTLGKLKDYADNGILITGVDQTLKAAQMMVSASKYCLPKLRANKDKMINNLEVVSHALVEGPHGTKKFIQNIQNPFRNFKLSSTSAPSVDPVLWRKHLSDISEAWTQFVTEYGVKLIQLISKMYPDQCPNPNSAVGKRSVCQDVGFFEMARRPGDNEAKKDIQQFVQDNDALYKAFNWVGFTAQLDNMKKSFTAIEKFEVDAGINSVAAITSLQEPLTSFKFYQTCVDYMLTQIYSVCHTAAKPDGSKVTDIKC